MNVTSELAERDTPSTPSFRDRLAAEVRAHMARRGWSNRKLATILGVTPPWVNRRVNGEIPMTSDDMELFADTFGLTITQLIGQAANRDPYAPTNDR
jgi:transcriptional regulator with XRE-family HTH domain